MTEALVMSERELLEDLIAKRRSLEVVMAKAKEIKSEVDKAEARLLEFMTTHEIKSTAKYEGLGFATIEKPELYARCDKEKQDDLFSFLRIIGREDMIKPSVHHKSLSTFVKERLTEAEEIPEFIKYGFVQKLIVFER